MVLKTCGTFKKRMDTIPANPPLGVARSLLVCHSSSFIICFSLTAICSLRSPLPGAVTPLYRPLCLENNDSVANNAELIGEKHNVLMSTCRGEEASHFFSVRFTSTSCLSTLFYKNQLAVAHTHTYISTIELPPRWPSQQ